MRSRPVHLYVASNTWVAQRSGDARGAISGEHAAGQPDAARWRRVAESLSTHFGDTATVRLVLSAGLCRFMVAPWISDCFTGSSIRASVMAMFAGQDVTDASHHIEIDWPAYGQPVPAVAYPRELVDAVRTALHARGIAMDSTVASVVPVLRRYGALVGTAGAALLAFAEDDGITGITLEAGRVVQVETLAERGQGLADVNLWLSRKRFAFADDAALHWLGSATPPEAFAGRLLPLEGDAPASAGHALVAACA